jgi:hypothetical protein
MNAHNSKWAAGLVFELWGFPAKNARSFPSRQFAVAKLNATVNFDETLMP